MRLYLDTCALKRPFDDQSHQRVEREAQAVLEVLDWISRGRDTLVWSAALTVENRADPDSEVREAVAWCASLAEAEVLLSGQVENRIHALTASGLSPLDAAHLAFAESGGCDVLLTCDDRFTRRAKRVSALTRVLNPLEYVEEVAGE